MKLWQKIFIALGCGIVTGLIFGTKVTAISWIGSSFLQLLNMLIVPLIFSSMVSGITSIPTTKELGRIGGKTLLLYLFSTMFAIFLGLFLAMNIPIGSTLSETVQTMNSAATISPAPLSSTPTLSDLFLSSIPKNPFKAFAEQNVLQIIVFGCFFGIALNMSGQRGGAVKEAIESLSLVMQKMTSIVMRFSPIGVFALMATAIGNLGIQTLIPVALFLVLYYVACLIHIFTVFASLLRGVAGLRLMPFFKGTRDLTLTAVSTCSSSACLPVAMQCATEKLGISKAFANFVLPLGCSLNMNGSALFQIMASVFIADAYGIPLSVEICTTLCITVLFATIGTASIPGAGFMMLSIVFSAIGVPLEGLGLLAGIDRLRDMGTTSLNVLGDAVCAVVVAEKEGELNQAMYYSDYPEKAQLPITL